MIEKLFLFTFLLLLHLFQALTSKGMWRITSKQSNAFCLAVIFCRLFKFVDQFLYFGASRGLSIDLLHRQTEVCLISHRLIVSLILGLCIRLNLLTGIEDTHEAFQRHFERELSLYRHQCIVSLVEQSGKEKVIGDAYLHHIIDLNDARLTYVTFDFHEHWLMRLIF